jgi:hypothetical protein
VVAGRDDLREPVDDHYADLSGRESMKFRKIDIIAMLFTVSILVFTGNFLDKFKTNAVAVSFFSIYVVISLNWRLRDARWFQILISGFVIFHAAVVAFCDAQLPRGPAMAYIVPIMFADIFGMLGIVGWSQKRILR